MEEQARALADAVERALPAWVEACVRRHTTDPDALAQARTEGERAAAEVGREMRALLGADIDLQRTTPLSLLRDAISYPAGVLRRAGVPPVARDDESRRLFPDDDYDLTPATFGDLGDDVLAAGIAWGAAKAWTHRKRHAP